MTFFDTSVIVAASYQAHPRHVECDDLLSRLLGRNSCMAAHSLAEIFSSLTRLPLPTPITPTGALQIIESIGDLCQIITLTQSEYLATIKSIAARGLPGGIVYDALLLACARKVEATAIYTLNLKHFRLIAPDLATRIIEP